ncbi:hypothetical protein CYMTET_27622 [Cymbomonas tetramitiformis]|uniref:Uncharacterized protein n=1 Tax=Cymbomonas tetramitiformis TaxID=36881 RepID=A0AAE0FPZ8_9CHLO|nr:hypothetical protein CYMTET_27622 [Cymbomonas tetramitiformis]
MVGQTLRGQLKDLQQEKEALQNEEAKLAKRVAAKEAAQREMKKQKRKQEKLQREGEAEEGFPGKPASFGGGGGAREARERAAIVESKKELAFVQAKIYFTEKQITQVERQTKDEKQASSEPAKHHKRVRLPRISSSSTAREDVADKLPHIKACDEYHGDIPDTSWYTQRTLQWQESPAIQSRNKGAERDMAIWIGPGRFLQAKCAVISDTLSTDLRDAPATPPLRLDG